jgi:hypothetical protein
VVTVLEACAYAAVIPNPVGEELTPMMLLVPTTTTKTIAATIIRRSTLVVVESEIHFVLLSKQFGFFVTSILHHNQSVLSMMT